MINCETNGNISPLVDLHRQIKAAGITVRDVIKLLLIANDDLKSVESRVQDLKKEEAATTAKNLTAISTFQLLSRDVSEVSRILNEYRSSCKEEQIELAKLRLQEVKLESLVREFQDNNEYFCRIKELVNREVRQSLTHHRHVLSLAFLSVIDSCRRDPLKFNILYHNLSLDAITRETRLAEFGMIDQHNYGLSNNDQSCYHHENSNDVDYWKVLVDVAEHYFNVMIKELEQMSISRMLDLFVSGSMTLQLAKKSIQNSNAAPPISVHQNEKE